MGRTEHAEEESDRESVLAPHVGSEQLIEEAVLRLGEIDTRWQMEREQLPESEAEAVTAYKWMHIDLSDLLRSLANLKKAGSENYTSEAEIRLREFMATVQYDYKEVQEDQFHSREYVTVHHRLSAQLLGEFAEFI